MKEMRIVAAVMRRILPPLVPQKDVPIVCKIRNYAAGCAANEAGR